MTKLNYIFILLLGLLALQNCKSQQISISDTNKNNIVNTALDSVSYKIINDSLYCKALGEYYHFQFLKVRHDNKIVEGRINSFLVDYDIETRSINLKNISNKEYIHRLKEIVRNNCNTETDISGWEVINTEYDVTLNEKKMLGIKLNWLVDGFTHSNQESFNFDLITGKEIITKKIFNKKTTKLLNSLSSFLLDEINSHLKSILNNDDYSKMNKENYKEEFNEYINNGKYLISEIPSCYITKEGNTLGVEFHLQYEMMAGYNHGAYTPFFFSFEKLKPYLTEDFITFISLN